MSCPCYALSLGARLAESLNLCVCWCVSKRAKLVRLCAVCVLVSVGLCDWNIECSVVSVPPRLPGHPASQWLVFAPSLSLSGVGARLRGVNPYLEFAPREFEGGEKVSQFPPTHTCRRAHSLTHFTSRCCFLQSSLITQLTPRPGAGLPMIPPFISSLFSWSCSSLC